jgi:outer membrane receptor protein involved in Fe transport
MGYSACTRVGLWVIGGTLVCTGVWALDTRQAGAVEEIVVTATRREERLSDVPISVAAYGQEQMDAQGVRSIDDIARLTPGITFTRADGRNASASSIAIRGISSTVAASTTGIYIDDTPIQTRIIGAGASNFNTYPAVFDLERVEVLRGPQGTLFGSGSEGGTLRFITPAPGLDEYTGYARVEGALIENGGTNYEAGAAIGGPIVEGKLGFRVSAWMRRDGGFVDRISTDPLPGDAPLAVFDADPSTPPTVLPTRTRAGHTIENNANWQNSRVIKGALGFAPTDAVNVTLSVYYQHIRSNDTNAYWLGISDPDAGVYRQGNALRQPSTDELWLPSLNITWDVGSLHMVSNTSYFDRDQSALNDYGAFESALWAGFWEFPVGMFAPTVQSNTHKAWTQEFRIGSADAEARLKWLAGVFYQRTTQKSRQFVQDAFLPDLFFDARGVPFAIALPCATCAPNGLAGGPDGPGLYTFNQDPVLAHDEQLAGFVQVDYRLFDPLTLTVGVRYSDTKFDATAHYFGPVVGPDVNDAGEQNEDPVTPRFGLSYQVSDDHLIYAAAAKGFRVGGYNPQVGLPCTAPPFFALPNLGYFPSPGNPTGRPPTFDSDTLWSYELGSKNAFAAGRAIVNASAYYIDWKNIQQGVALAGCGFGFTTNLGKAVSRGFDLELLVQPTDTLTLGSAIGYNDAEFRETVFGGPAAVVPIVSKGDSIPGSPWTFTANGQYDFTLFEQDAYLRFDYEFHSKGPDDTAALNLTNRPPFPPPNLAILVRAPETHLLSLRAGMRVGGADVSVFVRNLLNDHPNLVRGDLAFNWFAGDPHGFTGQTLVPRMAGVTVSYRY